MKSEIEIKEITNVFCDKSLKRVCKGSFARNFLFRLNKDKIRKIKEWDFYQITNDKFVLQLCIGHLSYVSNISATLFTLDGKKRVSLAKIKLFPKMSLERNPEEDSYLLEKTNDFEISFEVKNKIRHLVLKNKDFNCDLFLTALDNNQKMVILIPFKNSRKFYLNYKENCYKVNGIVKYQNEEYDFNNSYGLLDWGRGVWPYRNEWYWGNGSFKLADNRLLGLNIGYGFGVLDNASENAIFCDGVMEKVNNLKVFYNKDNLLDDYIIKSEDGKIDCVLKPIYDNHTKTDFWIVKMECHQVFGYLSGKLMFGEETITIDSKIMFFEHCFNRW